MGSNASEVDRIEHIEFTMIRHDLNDIPPVELPEGYRIRTFRDGDIANWCRIETSVDEFPTIEKAERYFEREFGPRIELMGDRSFMLETSGGEAIGTTTAWMGTFEGDLIGLDSLGGHRPRLPGSRSRQTTSGDGDASSGSRTSTRLSRHPDNKLPRCRTLPEIWIRACSRDRYGSTCLGNRGNAAGRALISSPLLQPLSD